MKLSEKWAGKGNAYGLHNEDKTMALLCLDATTDFRQLEEELETYHERHRDAKSNFATIQRLREENEALRNVNHRRLAIIKSHGRQLTDEAQWEDDDDRI